ncbi:hypothetical protein C8R47DRAFT_993465, partial [Mycena vitilis]
MLPFNNALPIELDKVTTDLPDDSSTPAPSVPSQRPAFPASHRGRQRLSEIRDRNRKNILEAPSAAAFWKEVKRLVDPAPTPLSVTADSLKEVFEKRLNPPTTLPQSFDAHRHRTNRMLANSIPASTVDPTAEEFFSAQFTEQDMEWLKDHIRSTLDSASGEDAVLYADIMGIPNEDLLFLCNECTRKGDGPCLLKVLTLLIHKRITDWANAYGLIPDYQNGFREGYRTNNNPFILRCVKEWARARGLTVYVAAVDATNAFPSTDHPTLWLKLLRMGMGGALFD